MGFLEEISRDDETEQEIAMQTEFILKYRQQRVKCVTIM